MKEKVIAVGEGCLDEGLVHYISTEEGIYYD